MKTRINLLMPIAVVLAMAFTVGAPRTAKAQSDPLLAQLMLFAGNFCPRGWGSAEGQLISINSNQALFSLLGCTYGGDCRTSFALPDLRGRVPVGQGTGSGLSHYQIGQRGGRESMTLTTANMPSHNHALMANSGFGDSYGPGNDALAKLDRTATPKPPKIYQNAAPNVAMNSGSIANNGGNIGFEIRTPYLGMMWCVAMQGTFPSRN